MSGRPRPRVIYADLDGTLTGPGGSLFAGPGGAVSLGAVQALAALHRAGVALVPTSGRNAAQCREAARLLGADGFIAELGGLLARGPRGEPERLAEGGDGTPFDAMARSGAGALLLEAFPGRLEPHAPWAFQGRQVTMLFRGLIDVAAAREVLRRAGHHLDVWDNGRIEGRFPDLEPEETHAYHLLPAGVSKGAAIATDLRRRGLRRADALVIGDSPADVSAAPHVGAVVLVANGAWAAPEPPGNVTVAAAPYGDGFAETVASALDGA